MTASEYNFVSTHENLCANVSKLVVLSRFGEVNMSTCVCECEYVDVSIQM